MAGTMDDKVNYLGAAIFWSYIAAALGLAVTITQTLVKIRPTRSSPNHAKRGVLIFTTLAILSFATLSYNMLNVLIQSYDSWTRQHRFGVPDNLVASIWKWSLTSYLFHDFAEAVVANNARYLWSQAGLLTTFVVCCFMSVEGQRARIPHLWAFFGLSQILPISFTQNLFYVALLRASDSPAGRGIPDGMFRLLRYVTVFYCCALIILPIADSRAWLMPGVLTTRIMLFAPFLLLKANHDRETHSESKSDVDESTSGFTRLIAMPGLATMLVQFYTVSEEKWTLRNIASAVSEHPAVSALGYDFVISMISGATWLSLQSQEKKKVS